MNQNKLLDNCFWHQFWIQLIIIFYSHMTFHTSLKYLREKWFISVQHCSQGEAATELCIILIEKSVYGYRWFVKICIANLQSCHFITLPFDPLHITLNRWGVPFYSPNCIYIGSILSSLRTLSAKLFIFKSLFLNPNYCVIFEIYLLLMFATFQLTHIYIFIVCKICKYVFNMRYINLIL